MPNLCFCQARTGGPEVLRAVLSWKRANTSFYVADTWPTNNSHS